MTKSKNLGLNLPSRDNTTDLADINVISENFEIIDNEFENVYNKLNNSGVVNTVGGNLIVLKDSAKAPLQQLKLYGKTTRNGTPTPDAPVPLVSVGDSGSFMVKIQGENVEEQTLTMPYTLPSIKEYKDEIDFARGVRIQKVIKATDFKSLGTYTNTDLYVCNTGLSLIGGSNNMAICNVVTNYAYNTQDNVHFYVHTSGAINVYVPKGYDIASKPIEVIAVLQTPTETPLTETELNAYRHLYTNKGNTTILSEADMEVSYVADTKLYIDNKIAELTALTLEG
jgi:hypothetical protein